MSLGRSTSRTRISLASGAGGRGSPFGLIGAVVLHGAVIVATFFTWENHLDIIEQSPPVVPVDLVTLAQKTNVTPTAIPQPRVAPEPPVPQVQADKLVTPPLPQESDAEPQPDTAPSEPKMAPPAPLPTPEQKPVPPQHKAQARKENFNVDNVLALLNHVAPQASQSANAKAGPQNRKGVGNQNLMTADLETMLFNEIRRCWSPPVGAPDAADIVVKYDVFLNPDGSVAQPPQLDARSQAAKNRGDPYVAAADFAATKAIYACQPYKLPADRYAQWREINPLTFDPREMMGQ